MLVETITLRIAGCAVEMTGGWAFECHQCEQKWTVPRGIGKPAACPSVRTPTPPNHSVHPTQGLVNRPMYKG